MLPIDSRFVIRGAARRWAVITSLSCVRQPSVLVILLTVSNDLIGFGIIVPLNPSYREHFGARGIVIRVIIASFSAMQFISSPIWGRVSDRYGRRPILLISRTRMPIAEERGRRAPSVPDGDGKTIDGACRLW